MFSVNQSTFGVVAAWLWSSLSSVYSRYPAKRASVFEYSSVMVGIKEFISLLVPCASQVYGTKAVCSLGARDRK